MSKLESIQFGKNIYPVEFKQTPNFSNTNMKKRYLVGHGTTSNSFRGGRSWLLNKASKSSALFIVGRNPGEITQLGFPSQKLWHAGRISNPTERFKSIASKNSKGQWVNPNLESDGIEFVGSVDIDGNGKVSESEVEFTEWQYHCWGVIAHWHAGICEYELEPKTQIIHQDIASYKPDLDLALEEHTYRLFEIKPEDEVKIFDTQIELCKAEKNRISLLMRLIQALIKMLKR